MKKIFDNIAKHFGFENKWFWCICCENEILDDGYYNHKTKMCKKCEVDKADFS